MILATLYRRLWCASMHTAHVRDWTAWDAMGIARCLHCHRTMPTPEQPPRPRL